MKKVWLIGGAIVSCLAGASMASCGGSSSGSGATAATSTTTTGATQSTTTTSSGNTGGTSTTSTTGTAGGSTTSTTSGTGGTTTTSTTGTASTSSGTCGKVTTLHPPPGSGPTIYCPFSGPDGGAPVSCTKGTQFCCETAEGTTTPSSCVTGSPSASNCPTPFENDTSPTNGSTVWECEDPVADCASGQVCCAVGYGYPSSTKTATFVAGAPGCGNYASEMGGAVCMAASACTSTVGFQLCTNSTECTGVGTGTCTPFAKAGNDLGACQ